MLVLLILALVGLGITIIWFVKRLIDTGLPALPEVAKKLYNNLVKLDETVSEAEKNILIPLQKRAGLIDNLVTVVKEAAEFEKSLLVELAEARPSIFGTSVLESVKSHEYFQRAFGYVLSISEQYPEIKSMGLFGSLMGTIAGCENEIADALTEYNLAVWNYNTARGEFPSNLIARKYSFNPRSYIRLKGKLQDLQLIIEEEVMEVPKVKF